MSEQNKHAHEPDNSEQAYSMDGGFDAIFDEEATRRIPIPSFKHGKENAPSAPDEFQLEERDYRPIRRRRDARIGCLGGIM